MELEEMKKCLQPDRRCRLRIKRTQPVNIEFRSLSFTVYEGGRGEKRILNSISGQFKSGQLHAIMGPSGAGKSTLLNILAAYKVTGSSGSVMVNGQPRIIHSFRKISRYIMQQDVLQPLLSVQEIMEIAADLKLPKETSSKEKKLTIADTLALLRLSKAKDTVTNDLSGGEKKRLSIALELLNNPPVLFLDEPTTGLDDISSQQCIQLLKTLAEGGRTVICSLHTPSARIFSTFDHVYVLAAGNCVYQGFGPDVVPHLDALGLPCPKHFNPADFIIEVCSGDYGDYHDRLVNAADNGRTISCYKRGILDNIIKTDKEPISVIEDKPYVELSKRYEDYKYSSSSLLQFKILLYRMWLQMLRDKFNLCTRFILTIIISLIVGCFYFKMGQDGSKTIFNFGLYYITLIKFLYIPMMPVLLHFPTEVQMIKREAFNKWYKLTPYFCALTISTIPVTFLLGAIYVGMVYTMTDQPLEIYRILQFYSVCMITALVSESLGLMVSSSLNLVNSMFIGPVLAVPIMLLAVYGIGYTQIPILIKIAMRFSYLRYALEGMTTAMTTNRAILPCPDSEEFCIFRDLRNFANFMGLGNGNYWLDMAVLSFMFLLFRCTSFYLLKQRLRPNKAFRALKFVVKSLKVHFNI